MAHQIVEIKTKVVQIIARYFAVDDIDERCSLASLGCDGNDLGSLLTCFEIQIGVQVPISAFPNREYSTINTVIAEVERAREYREAA
jgi:acyl carrier protein